MQLGGYLVGGVGKRCAQGPKQPFLYIAKKAKLKNIKSAKVKFLKCFSMVKIGTKFNENLQIYFLGIVQVESQR
jgi:hypothetical protein